MRHPEHGGLILWLETSEKYYFQQPKKWRRKKKQPWVIKDSRAHSLQQVSYGWTKEMKKHFNEPVLKPAQETILRETRNYRPYSTEELRQFRKRVTIERVNVKKLFHSNIKLQEKTILHKKALNQEVKKHDSNRSRNIRLTTKYNILNYKVWAIQISRRSNPSEWMWDIGSAWQNEKDNLGIPEKTGPDLAHGTWNQRLCKEHDHHTRRAPETPSRNSPEMSAGLVSPCELLCKLTYAYARNK